MKAGWSAKPLDRIARFCGGGTPSKSNAAFWDGDIPWVSPKDMWVDEVITSSDMISEEAVRSSATAMIPVGSILCVVRSGILARKFPVAITRRNVAINQDLKAIIPSKAIDSEYLFYFLKASEMRVLASVTTGATVHRLSTDFLRNIEVPLPPLDEQRRIVAVLDKAFANIATATANAQKNLTNARALFESYLRASINERGEGWSEYGFDQICSISSKLVDPRLAEYIDLPHVGAGNMESRTGGITDVLTAREEGLKSGKFLFDPSMVLYSKIRPYLMKACRPDFAGLCSADVYPLIPKAGLLDRDMLFHILMSEDFTTYAEAGSARAGMPKVNRDHLFKYSVWLPDVKAQRSICDKLDDLSLKCQNLKEVFQTKLAALTELKQSLLQKAFAGELT